MIHQEQGSVAPQLATPITPSDWTVERIAASMNVTKSLRAPVPLGAMSRAINAEEAQAYGESLLENRNPSFWINNGLIFAWDQLSQSASPETALSFQRIITALTTVQAWLAWDFGRNQVANGKAIYEARTAKELEDYQLNRWRQA